VNEESTLARIDAGLQHVLSSLDEIKTQLASVTADHRDLDRRVTVVETDLGHLRVDLSAEQQRQKENARAAVERETKLVERVTAVEAKLLFWAGGGSAAGTILGFALHYLLK
jgi:cob(I)alamin adenosyltransferase